MNEEEIAILANSDSGIIAADDAGTIVFANTAAHEALGRPISVGAKLSDMMPERLRTKHREGFQRYVETGESRLDGRVVRVPVVGADGREREVDMTIQVFRRPDGSKLAVASVQKHASDVPPQDLLRIESALSTRAYRLI